MTTVSGACRRLRDAMLAALALFAPTAGHAQPPHTDKIQVYTPPNGFWLNPSRPKEPLYGPTQAWANWSVSQWDIPADLPPFTSGHTKNAFAAVDFAPDGSYRISQTTRSVPCDRVFPSGNTLVNELDLFLSPNNRNEPAYPQASPNINHNLAEISHATHIITVGLDDFSSVDDACPLNQAALLTAVVFTNTPSSQTLFYQIRLSYYKVAGGKVAAVLPPPGWFFKGKNDQNGSGGQYGFGDDISTFGRPPITIGTVAREEIEILPRIKQLIKEGAEFGLDQDLSHWRLTGTYHGSNAFGHVNITSTWSNFALFVD